MKYHENHQFCFRTSYYRHCQALISIWKNVFLSISVSQPKYIIWVIFFSTSFWVNFASPYRRIAEHANSLSSQYRLLFTTSSTPDGYSNLEIKNENSHEWFKASYPRGNTSHKITIKLYIHCDSITLKDSLPDPAQDNNFLLAPFIIRASHIYISILLFFLCCSALSLLPSFFLTISFRRNCRIFRLSEGS